MHIILPSSSRVRAGIPEIGRAFCSRRLYVLNLDRLLSSRSGILIFAVMAQTQLQSQIIQLQQTLLNIHQDLLMSTYLAPSSSDSHLVRLIQTTRTARAASIRALNMQYQRLLLPSSPRILPEMPGTFPISPDRVRSHHHHHSHIIERRRPRRRNNSRSSDSVSSSDLIIRKPISKANPLPGSICKPPQKTSKLFCVYARDLQEDTHVPLADNYKAGGDGKCPFCRSHIATRPGKAWEVTADSAKKFDEHTAFLSHTFLVDNRFVIKSHRVKGDFACVLCTRFRKSDTTCRDIGTLMEHLWRDHTSEELEQDEDIKGR